MQVICVVALVNPSTPLSVTPERMKFEGDYVRGLYGEGVVRQVWSRMGVGGAVMLLDVESVDEATRLVSELPFIKAGLLRIEATYPLVPYRAFATIS